MASIRLATFNCENLFARFKFNEDVNPDEAIIDGWLADKTHFEINDDVSKKLTGKAISESDADIIALQEVESLAALRLFRNTYLDGRGYRHIIVLDGNDPRFIDVAVMSKYPIEKIDTHISEWSEEINWFVFSRDCLECDLVLPENKRLRLFVNHFKSMFDRSDPCNGRKNSRKKRLIQAKRVKEIVLNEFPNGEGAYAIIGDLNDYLESDAQGETSIGELVNWNNVENVVRRKSSSEQWTHYYEGNSDCGHPKTFKQLDYILLSKTLADSNSSAVPDIIRKGLPKNADKYSGPWFDEVGLDTPKASDHCPVVIEINV
jgi:endonuclease/exonuclease/phosphatase family metal-dependent hydrolase